MALVLKNNNCNLAKSGRSKITAVMMSQFIGFLLNNNNNYIRNRTSNTEIGRAKTGFASPISVLQVLF